MQSERKKGYDVVSITYSCIFFNLYLIAAFFQMFQMKNKLVFLFF